jgi:hypothetical protein
MHWDPEPAHRLVNIRTIPLLEITFSYPCSRGYFSLLRIVFRAAAKKQQKKAISITDSPT